jgi:ribosomal protein S18 acetylase RimI-like enzyme
MPARVTLLSPNIRPLVPTTDMGETADLIDLCFGYQMDQDGLDYLRYIRQVASGTRNLRWVDGSQERVAVPLFGYVWEEDEKIVGNISLSPFQWRKEWYYLIANVAVHPDFRRRGIAKILTRQAIEHCVQRKVDHLWLQVKDFNHSAISLYESLGFRGKDQRTTWRSLDYLAAPAEVESNIHVVPRLKRDWESQKMWLSKYYPEQIRWYFGIHNDDLSPGLIRHVENYLLYEQVMHHYSAYHQHDLVGVMTQQPVNSKQDHLYITVPEGRYESEATRNFLLFALRMFGEQKTIRVNYPFGKACDAFEAANFKATNTLIWMKYEMLQSR